MPFVSSRAFHGASAVCAGVFAMGGAATGQDCMRWIPIAPLQSPPVVAYQAMVYDPVREMSLFFTGSITTGKQTWEWNGVDWHRLTAVNSPQVFGLFALVYDEARGGPLLFGGIDRSYPLEDVYIWDGHDWTYLLTPGGVGGRRSPAMAYDCWRDVSVVHGGSGDEGKGSFEHLTTFELKEAGWLLRAAVGPRGIQTLAFDSRRGVCVGVGNRNGGETWEWDGHMWALRVRGSGPVGAANQMVFDAHRGVCVLVDVVTTGRLWEWDGIGWVARDPAGTLPVRRHSQAVSYDQARQRVVMFGGEKNPSVILNDTWEFGLYPDCDQTTGAGELDIFDFLCFLNKFVAQEPYACDCDTATGQGVCDVFDFMCFQDLFAGCP